MQNPILETKSLKDFTHLMLQKKNALYSRAHTLDDIHSAIRGSEIHNLLSV